MENIIEKVKEKLFNYNKKSFAKDGYDFWNNHIKYVFSHSHNMAVKRNADVEICELSALFHDMAMVADFGPREEHEIYGAKMARDMLEEMQYPNDKIELIEKCVLHHRGCKNDNRGTKEEQILADADCVAHFDSIPSLFSLAYNKIGLPMEEGKEFVRNKLIRSYQKLSPEGQKEYKKRFDEIMKMLFVE